MRSPLSKKNIQLISINNSTLLRIMLIGLALYFLFFIREVVGIVFVAWVLSSALSPFVALMHRYHVPRWATILVTYLAIIAVIIVLFALLIPAIVAQLTDVTVNFSTEYAPQLAALLDRLNLSGDTISTQLQQNLASITQNVGQITSGVFGAVGQFFNMLLTLIAILVLAFYMTIDEDGMRKFVRSVAPLKYHPYLVQKLNRIQDRMGAWLRGQLLLMLIISSLVTFALWALGVKYALLLGLIAGFMEFIPIVGPIVSAVPAVFFALTDSPFKGLAVLILYVVVQQLENNLIAPRVQSKAIGIHPLILLIMILVGFKVAGVPGVLFAIPATIIIWILLEDFFKEKEAADMSLEVDEQAGELPSEEKSISTPHLPKE